MLTPDQIASNYAKLYGICRTLDVALADVLEFYRPDLIDNSGVHVLGFETAPAGKSIHHAYEGGLVEHILEMLEHVDMFCERWPFSRRNLYLGCILHDFHKGFCHYKKTDTGIDYYTHYYTRMLTPNQKTLAMIGGGVPLAPLYHVDSDVLNIIFNSEGGWAENPSKEVSVEAKLVYLADELSVIDYRMRTNKTQSIYGQPHAFFCFTKHSKVEKL